MDFGHPGGGGHHGAGAGGPIFDQQGTIMSQEERVRYCERRGLCVTCGEVKTHKLTGVLRRRTPITNNKVKNGICLVCNPHLREGGVNTLIGSADVAVAAPLPPADYGQSPAPSRGTPSSARGGGPPASMMPSQSEMNAQRNWDTLGTATAALSGMGALRPPPPPEPQDSSSSAMTEPSSSRSGGGPRRPIEVSSRPSQDSLSSAGRGHPPSSVSVAVDSSGRGTGRLDRPLSSAGGVSDSAGSSSASAPQQPQQPNEDDLEEAYGWASPRPERGSSSSSGSGGGRLSRPPVIGRSASTGTPKDEWDVVKSMRDFPNDRALLSRQMHRLRAMGKNQAAAVYEVIEVMKRHPRDARLQAAACGAVWSVTALDDDQKVEAVNAGAVEAIVGGMKASPGDARLATWGLGALACLAVGTGNRGTVAEQGAPDAIVSALMAHPREPAVFEWAARALYSLVEAHCAGGDSSSHGGSVDEGEMREEMADTRAIVREFRSSSRLLPGLIRAMQFHPASFVAQEWSFRFLWVLLTADTPEADNGDGSNWKDAEPARSLLRSISDEGGLKVCMDVIRARPSTERLQEMAFALLCSAADRTSWIGSGNTDRIESVIELMMEYPRNAWMQEEACALLSVWVSAEDDRRTVLPGMGGLKAVLAAMDNHPSAAALHESACHILWTLSSSSSIWRGDAQLLHRVMKKLVSSLTSHSGSVAVQERALGALSNLLLVDGAQSSGGEENNDALLVDAVVSVLLSHSDNPDLVERGCRVLSNGCHSDPYGRMAGAIVDSGGVRATAKGMGACLGHPSVQEEGLAALCGVLSSGKDEHRAAVIESGGVEAIRDAMVGGGSPSLIALLRGTYAVCMVTLCKRCDQSVVREGVVDAVVMAMNGPHGDSNDLLTRSCLALRNFSLAAAGTGRTRREAAVPNPGEAMEAVLRILQRKGELNIQKEACGALFALSALCSSTGDIPLNSVFREMVRILENNKGDDMRPFNGAILGEALGALENLSGMAVQDGNMSGHGIGIHLDLQDIDVIIAVMYEALGQEIPYPDVVDGVFGVLLNLSHEPMYEDAIIQCGGIVSIIDAMQENEANEPIESKGCAILSRLSADNLEVKLCIAETDGVEVIISAMLHNPMTASLQVQACRTLAHLTIDEETRTLITQQGGIVLILQAMSNHPEDAELQETACEALCGLACDAHESVLAESNVVGAVIDTMRTHVDSPRVQERALGILQNLSMRSSASKMAVASAHGIEEIVSAIRENMTSSEVLERAFTALWSLAVLDGNQDRIVAVDGISIIINAMMASISFLTVQKQACGCLCTLSSNPKCKRLIKESGGLDAIVFAMWAHLNSESLLVEACRALSSLAVLSNNMDGPDEANEGVVDAVILCMRRFPDSVKLQEIVCLALRNLSLSPSNLRLMKQRTDDLEKLLHKAAAKFPGECSQRANQVLTQLFD